MEIGIFFCLGLLKKLTVLVNRSFCHEASRKWLDMKTFFGKAHCFFFLESFVSIF